ncbi:MAG: shikimate kinase, partial [Bacteroidota bacterium]
MEKHILLVGMPGSGKSTLGKKWAEERAVPFYEIDEMLALKFGKSISEFVDECGWERFRSEELIQVEQVFKLEKGVVVPGGGFFSNQFNVNLALKNAEVYFLDVSIEILISR